MTYTSFKQNNYIKTFDHTYYFAMSSGYRKNNRTKQRELFKEPVKLGCSGLGFDSEVRSHLAYKNTTKKIERRDGRNPVTFWENLESWGKTLGNLLNIFSKASAEIQNRQKPWVKHLSLNDNPNMNNVDSIDFAIRDWIEDTDFLLPRICQEYPKFNLNFKSKLQPKPWGDKSDPIQIDPYLDENIMRLNEHGYKSGVWYYTNYPRTDHNDFAGMPNTARDIQQLLGLEYRPGFYINIYNRLRHLEFEQSQVPDSKLK